MAEIKKVFDKTISEENLRYSGGVNFCSWERMKDQLGILAGVQYGERIIGVIASERGVEIVIQSLPD